MANSRKTAKRPARKSISQIMAEEIAKIERPRRAAQVTATALPNPFLKINARPSRR